MADTTNMIMPMLREMRAENASQHERTQLLIAALDKRLVALTSPIGRGRTMRSMDRVRGCDISGKSASPHPNPLPAEERDTEGTTLEDGI